MNEFCRCPVGIAAVAALLAGQGWLTLALFGPGRPWPALTDDRPVVAGRHPLHQYHASLGARAYAATGSTCCYDPAFQAGYPKTPLFDAGCRPAELLALALGDAYGPAAYKIGLFVLCLFAPLAFVAAGRGLGLPPPAAGLAGLLGLAAFWSTPARQLLEAGDTDWLFGGLALVAHLGLLVRFDRGRRPFLTWLGLLLTAGVGAAAHPLLWFGFAPFALAFYLYHWLDHGPGWHLALWAAWLGGAAANANWLIDAGRFWWIRLPVFSDPIPVDPVTFDGWGETGDQVLAGVLVGGALLGLTGRLCHPAGGARFLFGGGLVAMTALAVAGLRGYVPAPPRPLLVVAVWLAVVPCAAALTRRWKRLGRFRRSASFATLLGVGWVLLGEPAQNGPLFDWLGRFRKPEPLEIGLSDERLQLVETLTAHTTGDARILWEDRPLTRTAAHWTAFLADLTGRQFLGGLDPDAGVEHVFAGLGGPALAGRPLADWSDADLTRFCRRYNVGWVATWSPAALKRLRAFPLAKPVTELHDAGDGWLFALDRAPAFILKGKGRVVQADWRRIALADVEPEDGQVVLSLHHHPGWRVLPGDVRVEREPDTDDPVPFLCLRLPGPVLRLTFVWDDE